MDTVYLLPDSIRQALIAYLSTKPYAEVAQGVAALQQLQPQPAAPAADAKPVNDP